MSIETKEELCDKLLHSGVSRYQELYAAGMPPVYSEAEVRELFDKANHSQRGLGINHICLLSDEPSILFFPRDYCFGTGVLPDRFVHGSTCIPLRCTPRKGLESGWVNTLEEFLFVFHRNDRVIYSLDDLLDYYLDAAPVSGW